MNIDKPVTFAILGCGARGRTFSRWILGHPDEARLIAIAEPNEECRKKVANLHGIPEEMQFSDWSELLEKLKLSDAIINTTMDKIHLPSSLKALQKGYHMLLEKPMATTLSDCKKIDTARKESGLIVSICHLLRYTSVYMEIKKLLENGTIGKIISIDQLEGVDPGRHAHSFVRGNWSREEDTAFMLLTKSCHDIDMIAWLAAKPCLSVSSFGHLTHFKSENAPKGAPKKCADGCPVEKDCPYSAFKVYVEGSIFSERVMPGKTKDERFDLINHGPYGRCVYYCDNDVVDHQVVNFEFEDEITATFTMTAFTPGGRRVRIHGTHGFIESEIDTNKIIINHFWKASREVITVQPQTSDYGIGDDNTMKNFIDAISNNDPEKILTNTSESLRTHAITFAAEKARKENRIVKIKELECHI